MEKETEDGSYKVIEKIMMGALFFLFPRLKD